MRAQFTPLFSIVTLLASVANATPTLLAERVDCNEGDGSGRHYVMVRPHEYTWLVGLDKLGADNWQVRGNTDVTVGPWYFTSKEPKPYTVEHFKLGMSQRHEGQLWDELMGKTGNMEETAAVYEDRPADGKCWVEAPYGISPGCVSISIYDEASGNQIISPSQADVTTRCEKRDKAWRTDMELVPLGPVPVPGMST